MFELLCDLCEKNGISVTALCTKVTGSSGNLSTWKKGYMRSDYLAACAEILGVSVDYLLGRPAAPFTPAPEGKWRQALNQLSEDSLAELENFLDFLLWKQSQESSVSE